MELVNKKRGDDNNIYYKSEVLKRVLLLELKRNGQVQRAINEESG